MADPLFPPSRLKPPFTYFGGKTRLAPRIAALLPSHEHFIEPFAGSLAVLLSKAPSRMETVNDLDGLLVNFWRQLRDHPAELERACALTPHSRAEHAEAFSLDGCDDLERARRVWVRLTQGRGGHTWRRTGWRYHQDPSGSHSSMPDYLSAYVSRIRPVAARLARVSIENRPALEIIRRYGQHRGCLIYADPPYLYSVRSARSGERRGYAAEMPGEDEHRDLLDALLACKAAVVVSGYPSDLYDEALSGWSRAEIPAQTGNGGDARDRTEVVWSNRPFPQETLMDGLMAS